MLKDRNSPSAILEWAWKALSESDIAEEDRKKLYDVAMDCARKGQWRGDVCDRWRNLGFGSGKIKDFYP